MKRTIFILLTTLATTLLQAQQPKEKEERRMTNDEAAKRALQVGRVMQQERVFLHFDNSAYYLGETMWFKAYVSYGTNDRITTPSKVLYVELVAPEGYVVETKKYKIDENGCCRGDFELNPLLLSGYYEVRAYTRYMLNWGKDAVFSRVFPIFDKVNGDNWDFKNMLDRKRGFMRDGEWISSELPDVELKFYPEGGHLVAGLKSKVAYELRGNEGEFINEQITIYADKAVLLTTKPTHYGKGSFEITPQAGVKYSATVTAANKKKERKEFKFTLPEVEEEGVTIAVQDNGGEINFTVENNVAEGEEYAFSILYRGTMGYYKKIAPTEKSKTFTLNKSELPEGVNKAIVFSGEIPLAERCFFIEHENIEKSDRSTIKLTVKGNSEAINELSLAPYEKVTLNIAREDGKPIPANANLSLAVSDAAGNVETSWDYNIHTYLLLGSELKGYIPNAAQYFNKSNGKRKEQLDLVMLTNGWTSYDWSKLTQERFSKIEPIERGITIKGSLFRKNRGSALGNIDEVNLVPLKDNLTQLLISYEGKEASSYSFRTDSMGEFIVETKDFYGKRIAALQPQITVKQNDNIRYAFALDRYFSPDFRLYDYWERNTGVPADENEAAGGSNLVQLSPFEFMLSQVEVVSSAKKEAKSRPPHSEMRFNFLDEWEYAQDVSYLRDFDTYKDEVYNETLKQLESEFTKETDYAGLGPEASALTKYNLLNAVSQSGIISTTSKDIPTGHIKYIGNTRYEAAKDTSAAFKDMPSSSDMRNANTSIPDEYKYSLTVADVVTSAMKRHNYNWAYWVQFMVVSGAYDSNGVPTPDFEYLHGRADAEKMMNFKEFVIRSDAKTREQFENTYTNWTRYANVLDNKAPLQKFYLGFYSQHYVSNREGVDGFPLPETFLYTLQQPDPKHPNYVACLIPYKEGEENQGITPDLANTYGTTRYTSLQGYNESKQFYSPDYSKAKPAADKKEHRRTILWNPQLTTGNDGSINIEFYNSCSCSTLTVDIAGRDGQAFYSNDEAMATRINEQSKQEANATASNESKGESDEDYFEQKMDPEVERACLKQYNISIAYKNQKRYKNAIAIWAELAKYNYAPAVNEIAQCYLNGTGLKKNEQQAKKFFENAAIKGNPTAQYELALLYKNGIGCEQSDELAATWMRRACLQKEPRAMVYKAKELISRDDEAAIEEATAMLAEAAQSGNAEAHYEYGLLLTGPNDTGKTNPEAISHIKTAAEKGWEQAMLFMLFYEHSIGKYEEAYRWAKTLSQMGNHIGTKQMADYYYYGEGVKRDKGLAKDLYRTAANAGNKEAARILEGL